MNCIEVKNLLHDYYDELLPDVMQKELESHIKECNGCKVTIGRFDKYFKEIDSLPSTINPSKNLVKQISLKFTDDNNNISKKHSADGIDNSVIKKLKKSRTLFAIPDNPVISFRKKSIENKSNKVTSSSRKKRVRQSVFAVNRLIKKILFRVVLFIILAVGGFLLYNLLKNNSDPWQIELKSGQHTLNGKVDNKFKIFSGDNIVTDNATELRLIIPDIAVYELGINSAVTVKEALLDENEIILHNGEVTVAAWSQTSFANVEVRSIKIVQHRSSYFVRIDPNSSILTVKVFNGDVSLTSIREKLRVAKNYICVINPNNKFGIPIREDAKQDFKKAVLMYQNGNNESVILQTITSLATKEDAFTLLDILLKERIFFDEVYSGLKKYFPSPPEVTKDGLKQRLPEMYDLWWQDINRKL